jgi:hypothetical protein
MTVPVAVLAQVSEAEWQQSVVSLARLYGWRVYHTHDSRHSTAGFPDLVLVRGRRLIFLELKREGKEPDPEQRGWLHDLGDVEDVRALWATPSAARAIQELLA